MSEQTPQFDDWQDVADRMHELPEALHPHAQHQLVERGIAPTSADIGTTATHGAVLEPIEVSYGRAQPLADTLMSPGAGASELTNALSLAYEPDGSVLPETAASFVHTVRDLFADEKTHNRSLQTILYKQPELLRAATTFATTEEATDWDRLTVGTLLKRAAYYQRDANWDEHSNSPDEPNLFEKLQTHIPQDTFRGDKLLTSYGRFRNGGVTVATAIEYDKFHEIPQHEQRVDSPQNIIKFVESVEKIDPFFKGCMTRDSDSSNKILRAGQMFAAEFPEDVQQDPILRDKMLTLVLSDSYGDKLRTGIVVLRDFIEAGVSPRDMLEKLHVKDMHSMTNGRGPERTQMEEAIQTVLLRPDIFRPFVKSRDPDHTISKELYFESGIISAAKSPSTTKFIADHYDKLIVAGYPRELLRNEINGLCSGNPFRQDSMTAANAQPFLRTLLEFAPDIVVLNNTLGGFTTEVVARQMPATDGLEQDNNLLHEQLRSINKSLLNLKTNNPLGFEVVSKFLTDARYNPSQSARTQRFDSLNWRPSRLGILQTDLDALQNPAATILYLASELSGIQLERATDIHEPYLDPTQHEALLQQLITSKEASKLAALYTGDSRSQLKNLGYEQQIAEAFLDPFYLGYAKQLPEGSYQFSAEQITQFTQEIFRTLDVSASDPDLVSDTLNESFAVLMELAQTLPAAERPSALVEADKMFGSYANVEVGAFINALQQGKLSKEAELLGITNTGETGINQLREVAQNFIAEVRSLDLSDESLALLARSPLLRTVLKQETRYAESEWGGNGEDELKNIINDHRQLIAEGSFVPMPSEYRPSAVVEISKRESSKEKQLWSEDVVDRYRTILDDLLGAESIMSTSQGQLGKRKFTYMLETLQNTINQQVLPAMLTKLDDPNLHERGRLNLEARFTELQALVKAPDPNKPYQHTLLRSLKDFEQHFKVLARHDELHGDLREIVFAWALRRNEAYGGVFNYGDYEWSLDRDPPSIEQVSRVREFVDHIVNQETFKQYFTDKQAADMFRRITSVKALEEGLQRAQSQTKANGITPLQFVPTRGLGLELSGHIANACWASEYESVAEAMPNMSAVVFKQNPGTSKEKLVGAGLLIESTTRDGEPILIMRGSNPLENYINQVAVDEFFTRYRDYAADIARQRGMKLGIVIDDHIGGSASNRPVLYGYLNGLRSSLKNVRVNNADTEFNGYDISHDVYLLENNSPS